MATHCVHCGQSILLKPETRDVCAACTKRGGPPAPVVEQDMRENMRVLPPEVAETLVCERADCADAVLPLEDVDWADPPTRTRAQRRAEALRTECWAHHQESHGLAGEFRFVPGRGVERAG